MSFPRKLQRLSVDEYLEAEKDSPFRHEYVDGQIYAMAGASDRHNRLAGTLYNHLDDCLGDGPCEPFIADMKVWVSETVFYYPDVVVACEGPSADPYYRKQPRLITEVSSPATEGCASTFREIPPTAVGGCFGPAYNGTRGRRWKSHPQQWVDRSSTAYRKGTQKQKASPSRL